MRYDKEKLDKHIIELINMSWYVNDDVIWEKQEMQENHFDKLPKAEQVALIDIGNKLKNAVDALTSYKHWFLDNN
jgi:hypothetical protein